jgi:hypothetical protein
MTAQPSGDIRLVGRKVWRLVIPPAELRPNADVCRAALAVTVRFFHSAPYDFSLLHSQLHLHYVGGLLVDVLRIRVRE